MLPLHQVVMENVTHGHRCGLRGKREEKPSWECKQNIQVTYLCFQGMHRLSLTDLFLLDDIQLSCVLDFRSKKHLGYMITW